MPTSASATRETGWRLCMEVPSHKCYTLTNGKGKGPAGTERMRIMSEQNEYQDWDAAEREAVHAEAAEERASEAAGSPIRTGERARVTLHLTVDLDLETWADEEGVYPATKEATIADFLSWARSHFLSTDHAQTYEVFTPAYTEKQDIALHGEDASPQARFEVGGCPLTDDALTLSQAEIDEQARETAFEEQLYQADFQCTHEHTAPLCRGCGYCA